MCEGGSAGRWGVGTKQNKNRTKYLKVLQRRWWAGDPEPWDCSESLQVKVWKSFRTWQLKQLSKKTKTNVSGRFCDCLLLSDFIYFFVNLLSSSRLFDLMPPLFPAATSSSPASALLDNSPSIWRWVTTTTGEEKKTKTCSAGSRVCSSLPHVASHVEVCPFFFLSFFFHLSPISGLFTPHRLLRPMRRGGGEGRKEKEEEEGLLRVDRIVPCGAQADLAELKKNTKKRKRTNYAMHG